MRVVSNVGCLGSKVQKQKLRMVKVQNILGNKYNFWKFRVIQVSLACRDDMTIRFKFHGYPHKKIRIS